MKENKIELESEVRNMIPCKSTFLSESCKYTCQVRNECSLWKDAEIKTKVSMIYATKGKWFGVTFIKRTTGEERKMTCRLGVKKFVNGVGQSFDPRARNLVTVWDTVKKEYRMINLDGLKSIRFQGQEQKF